MNIKVAEVFPGEHSLALLLQNIPVDTDLDAFGQSAYSGEIRVEDQFAYESEKVRVQRVFVAKNADTDESYAVCFAYPMMLEGRMDPKIALMLRASTSPYRDGFAPSSTLKLDLRVTDPAVKTRGIGRGFAMKIARKYLFAPESRYDGAIALVARDDAASVAFAASLAGRRVADLHNRLLFHFAAEKLRGE